MLSGIYTCLAGNLEKKQCKHCISGTEKCFILCSSIKFQVRLEEALKEVKKHLAPERKVFEFNNKITSICSLSWM